VLLVVRVEADDQALQRMRDIVTRDLDRFSRHDVTVAWHSSLRPMSWRMQLKNTEIDGLHAQSVS
jgi:hypothetical protein